MVLNSTKESIMLSQIMGQKNETRIIEGDMIVPDIKPDMLNTITSSGNVCIYKKEVLDGRVKIEGSLQVFIMYLADDETQGNRGLQTSLDFTEIIPIENCREGMTIRENVALNSIETKVLNGRKINMRASLTFSIKLYSNESTDLIKEIDSGELKLEMRKYNPEINILVGEGTTKSSAKETISIDPTDNLAEILKADVKIQNKDNKISYNKVLTKADVTVHILYLTDDNRISAVDSTIPVMGFVDIPNVNDGHICITNYELQNLLIKPNQIDEHSIYVEAEVEMCCSAFETRNIEVIEDLYSPCADVSFNKKDIKAMSKTNRCEDVLTLREKLAVQEMAGGKIYDVSVKPVVQMQNVSNGRMNSEGEMEIKILFWNGRENRLDAKLISVPFQFSMDMQGVGDTAEINKEITKCNIEIMQDGFLNVEIDLLFSAENENYRTISLIDEINAEEERKRNNYSMVIYFVKPEDTLWNIAKKFGSTVDNIVKINKIENPDLIMPEQQLYIPRYCTKKIA